MNYCKLVQKTEASLAYMAGPSYAARVMEAAAENAASATDLDDAAAFYEALYLGVHGVLESLNAPAAYFDCIA